MLSFTHPEFVFSDEAGKKTAEILSSEIISRTGESCGTKAVRITLLPSPDMSEDSFIIEAEENALTFISSGIRGYIFAIGRLLRKSVVKDGVITLTEDISGNYSPDKKIRGHQLGYRQTSNTYDAWDIDEYKRYYLDLMYFGMNTCEHIPYEGGKSDKNQIMRRDEQELLCEAAKEADRLGLMVSVWYPNCEKDIEAALKNRERLFSSADRLDYIFPPGGDPGDLQPDELMTRCEEFRKILREYHPDAEMWPSAQQPHQYPDWGTKFLTEMRKNPDFIDGVITGPNAAFPLHVLRRHLPGRYPIRLYPDITHNLRCEYPVHFDRDDWHYALQVVNGRESANPRPAEYKRIHELTRDYVIGSVSYSEGVNDDINKAVWSALDFNPHTPLREILEDYSRLFFIGADYKKAADAIFGLEKNWEGAPDENPCIEYTLKLFLELGEETPSLKENWRYVQCLFRARCDAFVRRKVLHENSLIAKSLSRLMKGDIDGAHSILLSHGDEDVTEIRKEIDEDADKLFRLIGLQTGTEKYHAKNFERGAILDTIDLALTDLPWLLTRFEAARDIPDHLKKEYLLRFYNRTHAEKEEYYYSVAHHGICPGGVTQDKGFYMNIQGDVPNKNKGALPTALFKFFDHMSFRLRAGGLGFNEDYILQITHRDLNNSDSVNHTVKINGRTIYSGQQFGGERNTDYERDFLPEGYIAVQYRVPAEYIINGCVDLEITEPVNGFEVAELRFMKKPYSSLETGGTK